MSALLLYLAVRNADLGRVRDAISDAELGTLALAVVVVMFVFVFQAIRWRVIVNRPRPPRARYVEFVYAGLACNNLAPGRVGDFLRARWLSVEAPMPYGRGLATVVVDRVFDVVALVLFLCVSASLVIDETWLLRIAAGGVVLLLGFVVVRALAQRYTRGKVRERRERGLVRRMLRDVLEGLAEPLDRRRVALAVAFSVAAWGTWAVAALLVASSLGIELSVLDAVFVAAIVNLGAVVPSSPGFVGTFHWLGVQSLGLLGIGLDDALACTILLHAVWYLPTTLVGLSILALRIDWKGIPRHRSSVPESSQAPSR